MSKIHIYLVHLCDATMKTSPKLGSIWGLVLKLRVAIRYKSQFTKLTWHSKIILISFGIFCGLYCKNLKKKNYQHVTSFIRGPIWSTYILSWYVAFELDRSEPRQVIIPMTNKKIIISYVFFSTGNSSWLIIIFYHQMK